MRIAVLFSRLSGYMAACLRVLKEQYDVELLIVRIPPADEAPFEASQFASLGDLHDRSDLDRTQLLDLLHDFRPQAVFMSGWFDRDYLAAARAQKKRGVPVVAGSDAQWTGSMRQRVGQLVAPWYLHSAIDVLWVAGERQRQLAHRFGFSGWRCWQGVYACDRQRFTAAGDVPATSSPSFLFVGRYVRAKGLDVLMQAYRRYRETVDEPWPLVCVGTGPLEHLLHDQAGVVHRGFVQPDELPGVMRKAAAFVLASRHEPWGVVVQEAAASGLPLVCTEACGAAVHLLQDGYNGFLVGTDDAEQLARSMRRITRTSTDERQEMGRRSRLLSEQFTPERWADTLMQGIEELYAEK